MATRLARFESGLSELRYIPTAKHVRATVDGRTIVDSRRAVLLWEPQRVVPQYAVPVADVAADLVPGRPGDGDTRGGPVRMGDRGTQVLTRKPASATTPLGARYSPCGPRTRNG
jgi:hypothetical protein